MTSFQDRAAGWMRDIESYNLHRFALDPKRTALLIIDMQNYFVHADGAAFIPATQDIIENIISLQHLFRDNKLPVIFTSHSHKSAQYDGGNLTWWWDSFCEENTWGAEIYEKIRPLPGEKIIHKHRYTAFQGTDLELTLRCLNIGDLVITGVMTNICCETTTRDAFCRDYRVQFVSDATATSSEDLQVATLKNVAFGFAPVVLTGGIIKQLP